jgi:hypothetical protein
LRQALQPHLSDELFVLDPQPCPKLTCTFGPPSLFVEQVSAGAKDDDDQENEEEDRH